MKQFLGIVVLATALAAHPQVGVAQEGADADRTVDALSLADALLMARQNNPVFRQFENDQPRAEWAVREAYGQLVPSARANAALAYEGVGSQTFGSLVSEGSTDYRRSSYSVTLNYALSAETFARIDGSRAGRDATSARTNAAAFNLETAVTRQYLASLRAQDAVRVAERQRERAETNHEITSARVEAGVALPTDRKQTEVDLGRAEIAVLRSENNLRAEKLRLSEQLGVQVGGDFELTSQFEIFDPAAPGVTRDTLLSLALEAHPNLRALRADEDARGADVWTARSQYFPSLNVFAQWAGFTRQAMNEEFVVGQYQAGAANAYQNCSLFNDISDGLTQPLEGFPQNCDRYIVEDEDIEQFLSTNNVWPWNFTNQPFFLQAQISIPIFQGFTRQRQVEQARVQADNAWESTRAEELRLQTAVTTAFDSLMTSYDVVEIEQANLTVAQEQRELAQERYSLGAAPYLELLQAEESLATAERDYLNAVYDFHNNLSSLENSVGARLIRDIQGEADPNRSR